LAGGECSLQNLLAGQVYQCTLQTTLTSEYETCTQIFTAPNPVVMRLVRRPMLEVRFSQPLESDGGIIFWRRGETSSDRILVRKGATSCRISRDAFRYLEIDNVSIRESMEETLVSAWGQSWTTAAEGVTRDSASVLLNVQSAECLSLRVRGVEVQSQCNLAFISRDGEAEDLSYRTVPPRASDLPPQGYGHGLGQWLPMPDLHLIRDVDFTRGMIAVRASDVFVGVPASSNQGHVEVILPKLVAMQVGNVEEVRRQVEEIFQASVPIFLEEELLLPDGAPVWVSLEMVRNASRVLHIDPAAGFRLRVRRVQANVERTWPVVWVPMREVGEGGR
jgi:hypothetical protein